MKGIKNSIAGLLIVLSITSCLKDDEFGKSPYNAIKELSFTGQLASPSVDSVTRTYTFKFDTLHDLTASVISKISLSNFASSDIKEGAVVNLSSPASLTINAENGESLVYTIVGVVDSVSGGGGDKPQIENSNFDNWYKQAATFGGDYWEPGGDKNSTLWATANEGVTALNAKDANTLRHQVAGSDYAVEMKTTAAPAIVRLASATIFTGKFHKDKIEISDPSKSVEYGIPFTSKPVKFKFDYQYMPGASNEDKDGNKLGYPDSYDIYVILENRSSGIKRVGTGWLRNSDEQTTWKTLEQSITYGELPAGSPTYMGLKSGHTWGEASDPVTHIYVVMLSSANGNDFEGAIGSTLKVNNFELVYE